MTKKKKAPRSQVGIRLDEHEHILLRLIAAYEGVSLAAVVRRLIRKEAKETLGNSNSNI